MRKRNGKSPSHRSSKRSVRYSFGVEVDAGGDLPGDFIDETLAIWQPRTARQLSREDGREIIENMTGFFRVLHEWDRAERLAKKKGAKAAKAILARAGAGPNPA
jgi:hypothetical protein